MNRESQSSYRSILKATSLFGGVQVYQILIGIIKSKIIAVLLGPVGVGILGLYTSAEQLVKAVTAMGLQSSAVRDISEANKSGDVINVAHKVSVLKRLIWLTGFVGMIVAFVLSPVLSRMSFGNYDYTIPFAFFSVTILLDQLCNGQRIILQGLRRMKSLALATVIGSTMGLVVSVPIYYWLGVRGIVPTLILTSCSTLLFTWIVARTIHIPNIKKTNREAIQEGSTTLKLGIAMSVNGILGTLSAYIIRSFIRFYGGLDDVGLFTAGFTLMTTYTGMVFTAMSTDYFPRLAEVNQDNGRCREIINQQGEIGLLILTPLMIVCVVFVPFIVIILYSTKFLPTNGYILWASTGMLFKMASWSISYIYVAKAEAKLLAFVEILGNFINVLTAIIGYMLMGITGLGIAFVFNYIIYLIIVYSIASKRYQFSFSPVFWKLLCIECVMVFVSLLLALTLSGFVFYIIGAIVIMMSSIYSYKELDRRIDISNIFKKLHGKR